MYITTNYQPDYFIYSFCKTMKFVMDMFTETTLKIIKNTCALIGTSESGDSF